MQGMKLELELHRIQAEILGLLLFRPQARFRDLNRAKHRNDLFSFHLKRLVSLGLMVKNEDQTYSLTSLGKEFANRFDSTARALEKQAKLAILLVATNSRGQYLIQQRLKQPYYGFYGWPTGKIRWGEKVLAAARRELKEETSLGGSFCWKGVWHKTDRDGSGKLLEDKYFFVVQVTQPKGRLRSEFDGGKNFWLSRDQLLAQAKTFAGVATAIDIAENDRFSYLERNYLYPIEDY